MEKVNFLLEQKNEITNYQIYSHLSKKSKGKNSQIFKEIALGEKKHYEFWKGFTKKEVKPNFFLVFFYSFAFRLLGITFAVKFMERKEKQIEERNKKFYDKIPAIKSLIKDEVKHEKKLISLLNEERVKYLSAVILGLNDALVEITGTLAGLSLALPKASLVGLSGLITGVAASLSMAASGYLSVKADNNKNPIKASIYTGITYIVAVIFLVLPFSNETERVAGLVFSTILGDGMSSKLFTEVREKRGLAYAVKTMLEEGKNYSYLVIYIGTEKAKVDEVIKICLEEFKKMGQISEKELIDGKQQVIGSFDVDSEGSDNTSLHLILNEIKGKAEDYYDFKQQVKKVSLAEIKRLAEIKDYSSFVLS